MIESAAHIPARFKLALKYERVAVYPMYVGIAGIVIAALTQQVWLLVASPFAGMPSAWLFNIRCYRCAWPAYRQFKDAAGWNGTDSMFAKTSWPPTLPAACTKCGAPFTDRSTTALAESP